MFDIDDVLHVWRRVISDKEHIFGQQMSLKLLDGIACVTFCILSKFVCTVYKIVFTRNIPEENASHG